MTPWSPTFAFYTLHTDGFLQNAVSKMKVFIRSILAAAFLVLISCAAIQHAKAEEVKDGVRIERDISYVPDGDSSQRLDLYLPEKGSDKPLPLLVWVHGGGWLGGSKKENPGMRFTASGEYASASVEYRFSNKAVFPAQIQDCQAAIRFLRSKAKKYNFDPEHI